jgi:hypothetical protein
VKDVPVSLPGHELVSAGLADLTAGRESEASLVVTMAAPRLRALGFEVPRGGARPNGGGEPGGKEVESGSHGEQASHRLYELLVEEGMDAHSRYNALVARMVSFARAAERASFS